MDRLKNLLREAILGPPQPIPWPRRYRGGNQAHPRSIWVRVLVDTTDFEEAMRRVQEALRGR
jgi:hypothetical protein